MEYSDQELKPKIHSQQTTGKIELTFPCQNDLRLQAKVCYKPQQSQRSNCDTTYTMQFHISEKPHMCDECGAKFETKSKLYQHELIHTGETPHKCDVCGAKFSVKSNLNRHALVHSAIKPYKCDECGVAFVKKCTLSNHSVIHSGIKPHKCDECGATFSRLYHLNRQHTNS